MYNVLIRHGDVSFLETATVVRIIIIGSDGGSH